MVLYCLIFFALVSGLWLMLVKDNNGLTFKDNLIFSCKKIALSIEMTKDQRIKYVNLITISIDLFILFFGWIIVVILLLIFIKNLWGRSL